MRCWTNVRCAFLQDSYWWQKCMKTKIYMYIWHVALVVRSTEICISSKFDWHEVHKTKPGHTCSDHGPQGYISMLLMHGLCN